jgi:hypothetical protein
MIGKRQSVLPRQSAGDEHLIITLGESLQMLRGRSEGNGK